MCGKKLRHDEFKRHMLEHEGKPIPTVNCQFCGMPFTGRSNLKRHIITQHTAKGEESHACPVCSKTSKNLIALREHIRRIHNVDDIHKCSMCGKGFKRAIALKVSFGKETVMGINEIILILFFIFRSTWQHILALLYILVLGVPKHSMQVVVCMLIANANILLNGRRHKEKKVKNIKLLL